MKHDSGVSCKQKCVNTPTNIIANNFIEQLVGPLDKSLFDSDLTSVTVIKFSMEVLKENFMPHTIIKQADHNYQFFDII